MKGIILAACLAISSSAFANPFDGFIGEYKVNGSPTIRAQNAKWCNRFDFKNIVGLKVAKDTNGYAQSHVLYILNPAGWSGHPTMDFDYKNEFGTGGSYAKSTGSSNSASNVWASFSINPQETESLTVSIEKLGSEFAFSMSEELKQNSVLTAGCYYQVKLLKK